MAKIWMWLCHHWQTHHCSYGFNTAILTMVNHKYGFGVNGSALEYFNSRDAACLHSVTSISFWPLSNIEVIECVCVCVQACIYTVCLCVQVQGGRGDMYKVWHLIWRHEHVRWSCCAETLRVQLLIPLRPTEVYTQPDYMSGLVSPAGKALGCSRGIPTVASYFSLHVISWTEFCFQPVRLGMITEDSQRLLAGVSMHRCCSTDKRV